MTELKRALLYVPLGSSNPVYRWMVSELRWGDFAAEPREMTRAKLAEDAAAAFGRPEWLDDPDHWVWDTAVAASLAPRR